MHFEPQYKRQHLQLGALTHESSSLVRAQESQTLTMSRSVLVSSFNI